MSQGRQPIAPSSPSTSRPSSSPSPRHAALAALAELPVHHFVGNVRGLLCFLELSVDHENLSMKGKGHVHHGCGWNVFGDFRVSGFWLPLMQSFTFVSMAHDTRHFHDVNLNLKWTENAPSANANASDGEVEEISNVSENVFGGVLLSSEEALVNEGYEDYGEISLVEEEWEKEHNEYLGTLSGMAQASTFGKGHKEERVTFRMVACPEVLTDAKARLMKERQHFWLAAVKENGFALRRAPKSIQNDREIVIEAIEQNSKSVEFASASLRSDKQVMLDAVRRNGHNLQHAVNPIPNDEEVVRTAVEQSGYALRYASDSLREHRPTVLAALASDGCALLYASTNLRADKDVVRAACLTNVAGLRFASRELQSDTEFLAVKWLSKIKEDWKSYEHLPFDARNNKEFAVRCKQYMRIPRAERAQQYRLEKSKNLNLDYHESDCGQLNAALMDGATALVRSEYIVDIARRSRQEQSNDESGRPLGRFTPRSETPPEAYYHGPIYENARIIAYSFQWATEEDPDPDGTQLQDLAFFLEYLLGCDDSKGISFLLFIDVMSLFRGTSAYPNASLWFAHPCCFTLHNRRIPSQRWIPTVLPSEQLGGEGVTIPATPTSPSSPVLATRTPQSPVFTPIRKNVSSRVVVSKTPGRGTHTGKVSYMDNGWTYFQHVVSNLKKGLEMILDLGSARDWIQDPTIPQSERTFKVLIENCCEKTRKLVEAPALVTAVLAKKHFLNKADEHFLVRKYEETFNEVLGAAKSLSLVNIKAHSHEWVSFIHDTLPRCLSLQLLDLSDNPELNVDVREIAAKFPPKLRYLHLHNTSVKGHILTFTDCASLEHLVITETKIEGGWEDIASRAPDRFYVRTDIIEFEV